MAVAAAEVEVVEQAGGPVEVVVGAVLVVECFMCPKPAAFQR